MTADHAKQQAYWNKEHGDKEGLPQMDSHEMSSGVVLFCDWLIEQGIDITEMKGIEMGCGKGRNVIGLAQRGASMVGIDYSEVAIEEAKRRAQADGLRTVFFQRDVSEPWQLDDNAFNFGIDCFLTADLETPRMREKAVSEMIRVLGPGAYMLVYALSSDDSYCIEGLKERPLQEPNTFETRHGKVEKCFDSDELVELYGGLELVAERRIEKNPVYDGKVYPARHHWMIFQKPV